MCVLVCMFACACVSLYVHIYVCTCVCMYVSYNILFLKAVLQEVLWNGHNSSQIFFFFLNENDFKEDRVNFLLFLFPQTGDGILLPKVGFLDVYSTGDKVVISVVMRCCLITHSHPPPPRAERPPPPACRAHGEYSH